MGLSMSEATVLRDEVAPKLAEATGSVLETDGVRMLRKGKNYCTISVEQQGYNKMDWRVKVRARGPQRDLSIARAKWTDKAINEVAQKILAYWEETNRLRELARRRETARDDARSILDGLHVGDAQLVGRRNGASLTATNDDGVPVVNLMVRIPVGPPDGQELLEHLAAILWDYRYMTPKIEDCDYAAALRKVYETHTELCDDRLDPEDIETMRSPAVTETRFTTLAWTLQGADIASRNALVDAAEELRIQRYDETGE